MRAFTNGIVGSWLEMKDVLAFSRCFGKMRVNWSFSWKQRSLAAQDGEKNQQNKDSTDFKFPK